MRYTYLFTQVSRFEDGNLVPINDEPYEFRFTFGKKIETFMGKSPDRTVLFTKDMWKEYPATNKEILGTVCFSTPSLEGFRRPLVMTKEADKRAGMYQYEPLDGGVKPQKDKYLSEDLKILTKTFVNGVRAVNNKAMPKSWHSIESADVKYLTSYIKSYVYEELLQDRDNKGKVRSKDFLKKVLMEFFALIPDNVIDKFDKGLNAHDQIRTKLEGVEGNDKKIEAILETQGYFKSLEDFKLFIALRKYILGVKNRFNHLVWVMYRSKIGLVTLKDVKTQLGAIFGFSFKVGDDDCKPKNKAEILKEICRIPIRHKAVEGFLDDIKKLCCVEDLNKSYQAALCYKFQEECHWKYLSSRYRYVDAIDEKDKYKPIHQEEFRDLCLRYWGITEKNTMKPNKCKKIKEKTEKKFNTEICNTKIWKEIKKEPTD